MQYSTEAESAIHITADDTSLGASQPSKASSQLKTIDLKTGNWSTFTFLWSYNNYGSIIIFHKSENLRKIATLKPTFTFLGRDFAIFNTFTWQNPFQKKESWL